MQYNADTFVREASSTTNYWPRTKHPDWNKGRGAWVLARPLDPFKWRRLKHAWLVLTGKADILTWTGQ